ncbi:Spectrin beta chain, non-erythrocytic 2, partial [Xenoophorus captivus]
TTKLREQSLKESVALHQFQTDANDMEAWIMETLRQVSSQEVGHDEFSTQTLARKQREIEEEIQSHRPLIDSLHEQAQALPQAYIHFPQVCLLFLSFSCQTTCSMYSMNGNCCL